MKRQLPVDAKVPERFLQAYHFRHSRTRDIYVSILRQFQRFVLEQRSGASLSQSLVQHWLKEQIGKYPDHIVCHRARLVDRFLEWMHADGMIPINPFAELRSQYGGRTAPIVRALLSEDADTSLQRLHCLPRFGSFLGQLMQEHVVRMRSLGYRYRSQELWMLRFDRFLQCRADLIGAPLCRLIEVWSESNPCPELLCIARKVGRLLSKAMHRLDPNVPILAAGTGVCRRTRRKHRLPYLYTEEEIHRVLQAALSFPSPKAPLRPVCAYTMLVLAYCAGLRLREIVSLTLADVHLQDGTIEIRDTKFFKQRRLPLAPSVMEALRHYLTARQTAGGPRSPQSGLFWNQQRNGRYSYGAVGNLLIKVLRHAGLKPARGRVGPRAHDLRHAMARHRLLSWYRQGINPQSRLPLLSTYLGHKDIQSTLVYLNVTPELLQQAGERFRKIGAEVLQVTGDRP
jgi:integrase/recombinase XerD